MCPGIPLPIDGAITGGGAIGGGAIGGGATNAGAGGGGGATTGGGGGGMTAGVGGAYGPPAHTAFNGWLMHAVSDGLVGAPCQ